MPTSQKARAWPFDLAPRDWGALALDAWRNACRPRRVVATFCFPMGTSLHTDLGEPARGAKSNGQARAFCEARRGNRPQ